MKITLLLLACLFVYVKCESCTTSATTCKATMCSSNTTIHCMDGICTCLYQHTHQTCTVKTDCVSSSDGTHHNHCRLDASGQPVFHCVDGECHCEHNGHHGHHGP